jgi:hypothetical protein
MKADELVAELRRAAGVNGMAPSYASTMRTAADRIEEVAKVFEYARGVQELNGDLVGVLQRQQAVIEAARALAESYDSDEPWDGDLAAAVCVAVRTLDGEATP